MKRTLTSLGLGFFLLAALIVVACRWRVENHAAGANLVPSGFVTCFGLLALGSDAFAA